MSLRSLINTDGWRFRVFRPRASSFAVIVGLLFIVGVSPDAASDDINSAEMARESDSDDSALADSIVDIDDELNDGTASMPDARIGAVVAPPFDGEIKTDETDSTDLGVAVKPIDEAIAIDAAKQFGDEVIDLTAISNGAIDIDDEGETNLPVAANVDLSEPIEPISEGETIDIGLIAPPIEPPFLDYEPQQSMVILGTEVAASTSARLSWTPSQSFAGIAAPTPVLVVNGARAGPVLCVTAAVHGDELNGIEIVRRVLYDLAPEKLSGTVVGVPIVNLQGFRRGSRYLPDRRDLNRFFPGNPTGSSASRLAHSFFTEVISHCGALVDLHTGSFQRTNLPQLRADLENPRIVEITQGFGSTVVLHGAGAAGTLRRAASDAGIPTVTLEAGEPARVQDKAVSHGAKGVMTLLNELGMYERKTMWGNREPVYYRSKWVRADQGGVLFSKVSLGDRVNRNQLLGTITDPITNVQSELRASTTGRVLGMALDQFVMPGFAAYRIGIEKPDTEVSNPEPIEMPGDAADNEFSDRDVSTHPVAESFGEEETLEARDNLEDSE